MNTTELRKLRFPEALRFVPLFAACMAVLAAVAFCHGCASPGELPPGAIDFVTNAAQRAAVVLREARERDDTPLPAEPAADQNPATVEADDRDTATTPEVPAAASEPATSPETSDPVLDFRWGGFRGGGEGEDPATQIRDFRMDRNGMRYAWAKGDLSNWGLERTDAGALICAFYWDEGEKKWIGGKFDWISTSRTTRDWENVYAGYNGWKAAPFFAAKRRAICIVSANGRKRTNLLEETR